MSTITNTAVIDRARGAATGTATGTEQSDQVYLHTMVLLDWTKQYIQQDSQ